MAAAVGAAARLAAQKHEARSGSHTIWGGVELGSSDTSGNSWWNITGWGMKGTHIGSPGEPQAVTTISSRSWQSAEKEGKKNIIARKIETDGIEMLEDSATESSYKDASLDNSKEAAGPAGEQAAGGAPKRVYSAKADAPDELVAAPPGPVPSVGSTGHGRGACKPCLFLFESVGCKDGDGCAFCHYPHSRRNATGTRYSKGKRDRFKNLLAKVEAGGGTGGPGASSGAARKKVVMSL